MSMSVSPARVVLTAFYGNGVTVDAFRCLRDVVEHFLHRGCYDDNYDGANLIEWLESLKPMIDETVATLRREIAAPDAEGNGDEIP